MGKEITLDIGELTFKYDTDGGNIEIIKRIRNAPAGAFNRVELSMNKDIPLLEKFLDICHLPYTTYPAIPIFPTFSTEENIEEVIKGFGEALPEFIKLMEKAQKELDKDKPKKPSKETKNA